MSDVIVSGGPTDPMRWGEPARRTDRPLTAYLPGALLLIVVAVLLSGGIAGGAVAYALITRSSETHVQGTTLAVLTSFDQEQPSRAVATFEDGTQRDIGVDSLHRQWTPDRPIVMIRVASVGTCAIQLGVDVVTTQTAPEGRVAVCVWVAPRG